MTIKIRKFGPDTAEEIGGDGYNEWLFIGEVKSVSVNEVHGVAGEDEKGFYIDLCCYIAPDSSRYVIGRHYINDEHNNAILSYDYTSLFEEPCGTMDLVIVEAEIGNSVAKGLFYRKSVYILNGHGETIDKY